MSWKQEKNSNKLTLARRQSSLSAPWGLLAEQLLLGAMALPLDIREITVVSQEVLEIIQRDPIFLCPSGNILHNYNIKSHQETDIGIIHRPYSDFTSFTHTHLHVYILGASLIAQSVKNLPEIQEIWVGFPGWEDPLEKEMATLSSILAWTWLPRWLRE